MTFFSSHFRRLSSARDCITYSASGHTIHRTSDASSIRVPEALPYTAVTYIMCRIRKLPFSTVLDYCIVYIPLGQAIGRWGNFFNQEAFGTTTTLPWGMTSTKISSYLAANCPDLDPSMPVHPTFLYESLCTITIFLLLVILVRPNSTHRFETTSVYMVLYGVARFFIESLRTDSLYLGSSNIRASQLLSLILVFAGLIIILVSHLKDWERLELPENAFVKREEKSSKK